MAPRERRKRPRAPSDRSRGAEEEATRLRSRLAYHLRCLCEDATDPAISALERLALVRERAARMRAIQRDLERETTMGRRKQAESLASEKLLQHLTLIQASLQRIEAWLARLAAVRRRPPTAERFPTLLSRAAVCQLLGVSPDTLYRRIRRGKVPRPAFGTGERSRWREEDLVGTRGLPKEGDR